MRRCADDVGPTALCPVPSMYFGTFKVPEKVESLFLDADQLFRKRPPVELIDVA